jgi:hypothetical protein
MTMPKGWKENNQGSSGRVQLVGERRRAAGKIMMVLGIFFALFGFLATEGPVLGIFGFILSIIGVIIYASGNRAQGRGTTVFGGGFVSTGGGE